MKRAANYIKEYGPDHPNALMPMSTLARTYFDRKDWRNAVNLLKRMSIIAAQNTKHQQQSMDASLAGQSGDPKAGALLGFGKKEPVFDELVKASYQLAQLEPEREESLKQTSFASVQSGQNSAAGAAFGQMASRGALSAAQRDAKLAALVRESQDRSKERAVIDSELTAAISRAPEARNKEDEEKKRQRLAEIEARQKEIGERLAKDFPGYAALANPAPLKIEEVQALLRPDEALVVFLDTAAAGPELDKTLAVHFGPAAPKPTPEETFIWVVTKTGSRWVRSDLGPAALSIEVQALRCGLDHTAWYESGCKELTGQDYNPAYWYAARPLPFLQP